MARIGSYVNGALRKMVVPLLGVPMIIKSYSSGGRSTPIWEMSKSLPTKTPRFRLPVAIWTAARLVWTGRGAFFPGSYERRGLS